MKYTRKLYKGISSLSMRTIPKSICDQLDLYDGQEVELEVKDGKIIITPLNPKPCE